MNSFLFYLWCSNLVNSILNDFISNSHVCNVWLLSLVFVGVCVEDVVFEKAIFIVDVCVPEQTNLISKFNFW